MKPEPNQPTLQVTVERFIAATPARIYCALTVASELEQWLFSDVQTDLHGGRGCGGTYKMRWRSKKDPSRDHDRFGRYLELVPDRKVVFEWKGDPSQQLGLGDFQSTIVSITLTPERDGTRVTLVHSGWPTDEQGRDWAGKHEKGWTFYFENLANYIASGPDLRESTLGQSVKTAADR